MRLRTSILFLVMSLVLPAMAMANNMKYSFKHITSADGLSASNVKSILRDSRGFMWFGTKNGLNVYDGKEIDHLRCFDREKKHGNDNIGALYEDKNGLIWIGTDRGVFIYDPMMSEFEYLDERTDSGAMADNYVLDIDGDPLDNIWIHLPTKGLFRYGDGKLEYYANPESGDFNHYYSDFTITESGDIYAVSNKSEIFKFDQKRREFVRIFANDGLMPSASYFNKIISTREYGLLIGTLDGYLYSYNPQRNTFLQPISFSRSGNVYLRALAMIGDEIWIGTHNGLYVVDAIRKKETRIVKNQLDPFSISDNSIFTIYQDCDGNAWLGTMFGGIDFRSSKPFRFHLYGPSSGLSSLLIRGLATDADGKIWVATENNGLDMIDPATGIICHPIASPYGSSGLMLFVNAYGKDLYAGYSQSGVVRISDNGNTLSSMPIDFKEGADNSGYCYLLDSTGSEWVGMGGRLLRRKPGDNGFSDVVSTGTDWIFSLFEDSDKNVWIGTMGNGVWKYSPDTKKFKSYIYDDGEIRERGLRSNSISSIMEDRNGNIWLSTDRGGLSRYNKSTDDFTTFGVEEGLPDNVIYKVLEDANGFLWFGTNKGLVKFNPDTGIVKVFTMADGLPFNEFGYHAATVDNSGNFYFGGINGIIYFNPLLDRADEQNNKIYFLSLVLLDSSASDMKEDVRQMMLNRNIRLPYDCASFRVKVSSPEYGVTGTRGFSYRLLPVNKEWIEIEGNQMTFSNLAPGKYELEVRYGEDEYAETGMLSIVIMAPWWKSVWAIIGYVVIGLLLLCMLLMWLHLRNESRNRAREELYNAEKERELYRNKVNFFTEIAHEIRTPLSLIDIPLEAIEENGLTHPSSAHYLKVTRQNSKRLLSLINQLLDFQKLDSHRLTVRKECIDISQLVRETTERFEPAMDVNNKRLEVDVAKEDIMIVTDKEAVTKILSNLLNNGLKYSRSKVLVKLRQHDGNIRISVTSDGEIIKGDERKLIFDPFYQGKDRPGKTSGVGIGLPLAKSLANVLEGELRLEDNPEWGNEFLLILPVGDDYMKEENIVDVEKDNYFLVEESNQTTLRSAGFHVLVVEDNESIRRLLKEQLSRDFFVDTASDGSVALSMLNDSNYDLVVTDIMMPVMDGMELCHRIKQDADLSSIPVVFITAKNDLDSKIRGLQLGAEAYIDKPFSIKFLKQTIKSLLENRRRERESFSRKPFFAVDNIQANKADEVFIRKCMEVIVSHISEEDFNVESLCDLLAMSRSNLLRKIKAIFNMSPSELIRLVKLKKAAELIQKGEYRINEICDMVGISSPSYFTKLFYKQFNITPKEFEKQWLNKVRGEGRTQEDVENMASISKDKTD